MVGLSNKIPRLIWDLGFRVSDFATRVVIRDLVVLSILTIFLSLQTVAQDVHVTANVDSNNILIGDWLNLHLEVRHRENQSVQFAALPDSLAGFEIVRRDSFQRKSVDRDVVEWTNFTITSYDTGTFVVPPLTVRYRNAGETAAHVAESPPIPIFVHGMAVDTTKDIKDIKPPIPLGISFAELLPYLIGVVVIAGVVWLVYYVMRKRKRGESIIPEPPRRPAHEAALDALRSLESEKLWQRGKVKEYHSQLTEILRTYIEIRFDVQALEMITDQILSAEEIKLLDRNVYVDLRDMLTLADLVKFAKLQPRPEENERSMRSAISFVEQTWRQTAPAPELAVVEDMRA